MSLSFNISKLGMNTIFHFELQLFFWAHWQLLFFGWSNSLHFDVLINTACSVNYFSSILNVLIESS